MQSEHKAMVMNNIIFAITGVILVLGLYTLGAKGWSALGAFPFLSMTYLDRKDK